MLIKLMKEINKFLRQKTIGERSNDFGRDNNEGLSVEVTLCDNILAETPGMRRDLGGRVCQAKGRAYVKVQKQEELGEFLKLKRDQCNKSTVRRENGRER